MIKKLITGVTIKDQMDKAKEILVTKVIPQSIKYNEIMKTKDDKISDELQAKITTYVYENYKQYKDKKLYINEATNCFYISDNKDASPLILGKKLFV